MQKLDTYIDEHGGTPKAPEQTKGKTRDGGGVTTGDVPQGYSLTKEINTSSHTGLSYPWGQCTWFVYNRGKEVGVSFGKYMGNGGQWMNAPGYQTTHTPTEHSALSLAQGKLEQIQLMATSPLWNKSNQMAPSSSLNQISKD